MANQFSEKIKSIASSELAAYPEAKRKLSTYLAEKEEDEQKKPEDYVLATGISNKVSDLVEYFFCKL